MNFYKSSSDHGITILGCDAFVLEATGLVLWSSPACMAELEGFLHTVQNTSAFWELLGAVSALSPPQDSEEAALYASYSGIGLSSANSGFDPNSLTDSTLLGMGMGLAAGLACVARTAQSRQQATQTSTRWQPLSGTASYGHDCKRHDS